MPGPRRSVAARSQAGSFNAFTHHCSAGWRSMVRPSGQWHSRGPAPQRHIIRRSDLDDSVGKPAARIPAIVGLEDQRIREL